MTYYVGTSGDDNFVLTSADEADLTPGGKDTVSGDGAVVVDYSAATGAVTLARLHNPDGVVVVPTPSLSRLVSIAGSPDHLELGHWDGTSLSLTSGAFDDTIYVPNTIASTVQAGGGNDVVTAGLMDDVLDGGAGIDTISYDIREAEYLGSAFTVGQAIRHENYIPSY
jgi:hypothetical protein